MKNNKFRDKIVFSGLFAAIGFMCCLLNFDITADTPGGCVLWSAEVCAVSLAMGCMGIEFSLWLKRKKFKAIGRRKLALSLAIALISGAIVGAAGQFIYALELQKYTSDTEIDIHQNECNAVFLLDCSLSMANQHNNCIEATCQMLDKMDDSVSFQFVSFSSYNINEDNDATELLPVNDTNRTDLKDAVRNISVYHNANNFDIALDFAVETIKDNQSDSRRNVIVLFSDCVGGVNDEIVSSFSDHNIEFYIIAVKNDSALNASFADKPLLGISDKSFEIDAGYDGTGSADENEMVSAFNEILSKSGTGNKTKTKTKLTLGEDMLFGESELTLLRVIVRIIFFGLITAVAGCIYYGMESKKILLKNFAVGAGAALLSVIYYPLGIIVLIFLGIGGFTEYEVEENAEYV